MHVVIVGAGALGSHVALFLRNHPGVVQLVDFDRVEMRNVAAQFHPRSTVGKNKALALRQVLQGLFGTPFAAMPYKLTVDTAGSVLDGADLIIDCTDNIAARSVIQGCARKGGVPCLHGCLAADGTFGRVMWTEHFVPDAETPGRATCEDATRLPFFALVAAQVAVTAQRFIDAGERRSYQVTAGGAQRIA